MKFPKGKYTKEQQAWCKNYEDRTGFDPMMDDFEAANETFYEGAMKSVRWYEEHSSDAHLSISHNVPGWEAAFDSSIEADKPASTH